jgi:hypothetical protein
LTTRWEVCDADGHRVGSLRGEVIRDRSGLSLAVLERLPDRSGARFRGPDGRELGTLTRCAEGVEMTFSAEIDGEPFVKMLLLAMALVSAEY